MAELPAEVEIRQSREKGRLLVAKTDIAPETVIFEDAGLSSPECDERPFPDEIVFSVVQQVLDQADLCRHLTFSLEQLSFPTKSPVSKYKDQEWSKALAQVKRNAFAHGKRLILFPQVSTLNHSCWPNAVVQTEYPRARVIAIAPIAKGDEITISYLPQFHLPTAYRRKNLQRGWDFVCQCVLCTRDVEHEELLNRMASAAAAGASEAATATAPSEALDSSLEAEHAAADNTAPSAEQMEDADHYYAEAMHHGDRHSCEAFMRLTRTIFSDTHWQRYVIRRKLINALCDELSAADHVHIDGTPEAHAGGASSRCCAGLHDPPADVAPSSVSTMDLALSFIREEIRVNQLIMPVLHDAKLYSLLRYGKLLLQQLGSAPASLSTQGSADESASVKEQVTQDIIKLDDTFLKLVFMFRPKW